MIATTVGWHGYDNPLQNCWTIDYLNESDRKKIKKHNRMKKQRSKQVDKLSKYLVDLVKGTNNTNSEAEAE